MFPFLSRQQEIHSPVVTSSPWVVGEWKEAFALNTMDSPDNHGFHVFLSKQDALESKSTLIDCDIPADSRIVVAELEVDKFNVSGYWRARLSMKNETWKRAKLVRVFALCGEDITEEMKQLYK